MKLYSYDFANQGEFFKYCATNNVLGTWSDLWGTLVSTGSVIVRFK